MPDEQNSEVLPGSVGDVAIIGEGTANRATVSLQLLQNIYHELTGKTEEVSKYYSEPFQVTRADFEQIHYRIGQVCEQYNIQTFNCSVKVYYINDTQDTFSSFDRFRTFNYGSISSIESVLITYNFLILLPKLNQPQSYTLTVRVASRIAIMNDDNSFKIPKIFRYMGSRTAVTTVKYVDYVVARTLLNVVDEWLQSLPKATVPVYWQFIRDKSSYIPLLTRYSVSAVGALFIFSSLPNFVPPDATLLQFARFWLAASAGLFAIYKLTDHLGSAAEDSIDSWYELSYIDLTDGDKNEIQKSIEKNKKSKVSAILKFFGALAISIIVKIIVDIIVKWGIK